MPREVLFRIFSFLDSKILLQIQFVCKYWYQATREENLWKDRLKETFHNWFEDFDFNYFDITLWRDIYWKTHQIYSNWHKTRQSSKILRSYERTIRQIQVTQKYLGYAHGAEIELRDQFSQDELFHIRPDFTDGVPYIKCFHIFDSKLVCSAGPGWTHINVYDLKDGRLVCGWPSVEPHPIEAIAFSDQFIVTGSRKCIVWDVNTRTPVQTFTEQQRGVVNSIQFDDNLLVCSHKGRKVRIWDIKSGKRIFTVQGHQHLIHCLQYDDNILATGSKDKTLRIWDKYKGFQCSAVLRGHTESVRTLNLQGWKIVSGSKDGDVRIWDVSGNPNLVSTLTSSLNDLPNTLQKSPSLDELFYDIKPTKSIPRPRSIGRLSGSDPIFSVASSSSRLYVGTKNLRVYDFNVENPSGTVWDKIKSFFE
uniref:F-box domain-containing protein n=1 Tax=Arcella intermedia TaxID=1963864 RepID=A0A6B2L558_9EUKA